MRSYLVTVEGAELVGDSWTIAPLVHLRSLIEREPDQMMPMPGEEVELQFPDGHMTTAQIVSFGMEVWKDDEGNFYTNADPSDPFLTLTITSTPDVTEVPAGTEI